MSRRDVPQNRRGWPNSSCAMEDKTISALVLGEQLHWNEWAAVLESAGAAFRLSVETATNGIRTVQQCFCTLG